MSMSFILVEVNMRDRMMLAAVLAAYVEKGGEEDDVRWKVYA